ncbi:MAG: family ATPase [Clostridiales bacterium]|nr:family ATPase [Clostridiales bacterium]
MFEVLGQEFITDAFKKAFDNDKVSHAYILTGPEGIGKSIMAMFMASTILCKGTNKPCGDCNPCIKISHGNHPDVKLISPKGRSIGVDNIRDLIDEIYTKPYEGDKKIVIIKNSDSITVQGQNAILKTLEEPSKDTTIIMLAENINAILPTIQSRCQILRLGRIPKEKIKAYLISQGVDEKKAATAANLSDGIVGNGLSFLDEKFVKLRVDTINKARELVGAGELAILKSVDFFVSNKDKIDIIFDILRIWYRDIIMLKLIKDKDLLMNMDYYDILVEESQKLSYNSLDSIINIINSSREKIRENVNYQLTIEVMLLSIQEV